MNDDKEELKRISYDMEDKIWQSWEDGYPIILSDEDANIIIEALNRQIPMKPNTTSRTMSMCLLKEDCFSYITCGRCDGLVDDEKYCPNCGQAIDWNEGDE